MFFGPFGEKTSMRNRFWANSFRVRVRGVVEGDFRVRVGVRD